MDSAKVSATRRIEMALLEEIAAGELEPGAARREVPREQEGAAVV